MRLKQQAIIIFVYNISPKKKIITFKKVAPITLGATFCLISRISLFTNRYLGSITAGGQRQGCFAPLSRRWP